MSAGSPIVAIRIPAELLAEIDVDVERSIQHDNEPRSTRTAWILAAVQEVLRHRERAKAARRRRRNRINQAMGVFGLPTQDAHRPEKNRG